MKRYRTEQSIPQRPYPAHRRPSLLAILCALPLLSGCDILWDAAFDCIDDDQPELEPDVLPDPILNQVYNEAIRVGIRNEPYDDSFDYTFRLNGRLPEGIRTESAGREFRFTGTPIALGDYRFSVTVRVEEGYGNVSDTEGLCSTVDSEEYNWTVQVM